MRKGSRLGRCQCGKAHDGGPSLLRRRRVFYPCSRQVITVVVISARGPGETFQGRTQKESNGGVPVPGGTFFAPGFRLRGV